MKGNKDGGHGNNGPVDTWAIRMGRRLRKRLDMPGQGVHHYFLRGVSQQLGVAAVSLVILWVQTR
ncbi:hypothetical protein [Streptomyces sp. C10-9-1]|uniref:hypothetical protein n=1 Tax=Streptomyces sp. C10-9-1 TaxID=1859285 RepID=UPI003F4A03E7